MAKKIDKNKKKSGLSGDVGRQGQGSRTAEPMARRRAELKSNGSKFWSFSIGKCFKRAIKLVLISVCAFSALVIVSFLALVGRSYVHKSNFFIVQPQSILVTGQKKLSRAEVLEAAGLDKPVNNLTLDVDSAINSLKSIPWVDDAKLRQSYPDGLKLTITEFEPKAIVNLEYLYYIDVKGKPFKILERGEVSDLPIISGFAFDDLVSASPLVQDRLNKAFELIDLLAVRNDKLNISNISEINCDPDRGVAVYLRGGMEIKIGLDGFERKLWRLGRVLSHLEQNEQEMDIDYINLLSPAKVVVKPRSA
ncbi:MAG: FtsQ-type POTRA domain-containing protein [Deltaproteobacteria bacterium]|jgi:cell division septal protein FtsQ|nr:FtsQ-type POTRA domain-containing protein [Deltaproteobacteria bacterium]